MSKKKLVAPKIDRSHIVVKSSPIHGKGVFVAKPIKKGAAIIMYMIKAIPAGRPIAAGSKNPNGTVLSSVP
jgi:SET domain-containing protein